MGLPLLAILRLLLGRRPLVAEGVAAALLIQVRGLTLCWGR
jgi:hypothetical protein